MTWKTHTGQESAILYLCVQWYLDDSAEKIDKTKLDYQK